MSLKFEVTLEQGNLIMAALGKQPYEVTAALIADLQRQAQPQLNPAPEATVEKAD